MTVGIVAACKDGVVVGADRKVVKYVGTMIKSLEDKVTQYTFGDGRPLLVCIAGGADVARRGVERINPAALGLMGAITAEEYRDTVEYQVARLSAELYARALTYDATLLFGMLDINGTGPIGHITRSGLTESKRLGYFTAGVGAPYAEMVLKDSFSTDITCEDAKLIIAGIIDKIGKVDNEVEGTDAYSVSSKGKTVVPLSWAESGGISQVPLSFDFTEELDEVKTQIGQMKDLEKLLEQPTTKKPAS